MEAVDGERKRPLRVTIIGVLSIIAGLIYLFPVLGIFGIGHLINLTGQTFQEGPLVLSALVIAIANFILGLGCLYGWRPIWFYLTIISVINFAVALIALFEAHPWGNVMIALLWLAIASYVLLSVQSKKTKAWFHR
jgi:hypothetical protein